MNICFYLLCFMLDVMLKHVHDLTFFVSFRIYKASCLKLVLPRYTYHQKQQYPALKKCYNHKCKESIRPEKMRVKLCLHALGAQILRTKVHKQNHYTKYFCYKIQKLCCFLRDTAIFISLLKGL